MKKSKKKMLLSHSVIESWGDDVDSIELVKHTQLKTGFSMYSFDLNGEPVITCDSFVFLRELMDRCDFHLILELLSYILVLRDYTYLNNESEE